LEWRDAESAEKPEIQSKPGLLSRKERIVEYQQLNHPDKCEQLLPIGCHQNLKSLALPVPAAEPDVADLLFL